MLGTTSTASGPSRTKFLKDLHITLTSIYKEKGVNHHNETPINQSDKNFKVLSCKVDKYGYALFLDNGNFVRLDAILKKNGRYDLTAYILNDNTKITGKDLVTLLAKVNQIL